MELSINLLHLVIHSEYQISKQLSTPHKLMITVSEYNYELNMNFNQIRVLINHIILEMKIRLSVFS